jgi:ribosomal protein L37AE/L43A
MTGAGINVVHDKTGRLRVLITYRGVERPLNWWAKRVGLPAETLQYRYRRGWPAEMVLSNARDADGRRIVEVEDLPPAASRRRSLPSPKDVRPGVRIDPDTGRLYLLHRSQLRPLADWARDAGLRYQTLRARILSGWEVDRAITEPSEPKGASGINAVQRGRTHRALKADIRARLAALSCPQCGGGMSGRADRWECRVCGAKFREEEAENEPR